MRWSSRSRATPTSSSSSFSSLRSVLVVGPTNARFSRIHAAGPCSEYLDVFDLVLAHAAASSRRAMISAIERLCSLGLPNSVRFERVSPKVEMHVMFERDPEAAMELHAFMQQLRPIVAMNTFAARANSSPSSSLPPTSSLPCPRWHGCLRAMPSCRRTGA